MDTGNLHASPETRARELSRNSVLSYEEALWLTTACASDSAIRIALVAAQACNEGTGAAYSLLKGAFPKEEV